MSETEQTYDCLTCGHPVTHHSANECWTRADGTETWDDDSACLCEWLTLPADLRTKP